jgi:hypothetical protein
MVIGDCRVQNPPLIFDIHLESPSSNKTSQPNPSSPSGLLGSFLGSSPCFAMKPENQASSSSKYTSTRLPSNGGSCGFAPRRLARRDPSSSHVISIVGVCKLDQASQRPLF